MYDKHLMGKGHFIGFQIPGLPGSHEELKQDEMEWFEAEGKEDEEEMPDSILDGEEEDDPWAWLADDRRFL